MALIILKSISKRDVKFSIQRLIIVLVQFQLNCQVWHVIWYEGCKFQIWHLQIEELFHHFFFILYSKDICCPLLFIAIVHYYLNLANAVSAQFWSCQIWTFNLSYQPSILSQKSTLQTQIRCCCDSNFFFKPFNLFAYV